MKRKICDVDDLTKLFENVELENKRPKRSCMDLVKYEGFKEAKYEFKNIFGLELDIKKVTLSKEEVYEIIDKRDKFLYMRYLESLNYENMKERVIRFSNMQSRVN